MIYLLRFLGEAKFRSVSIFSPILALFVECKVGNEPKLAEMAENGLGASLAFASRAFGEDQMCS